MMEIFHDYMKIAIHKEEYVAPRYMSKEVAKKKGLKYFEHKVWKNYDKYITQC